MHYNLTMPSHSRRTVCGWRQYKVQNGGRMGKQMEGEGRVLQMSTWLIPINNNWKAIFSSRVCRGLTDKGVLWQIGTFKYINIWELKSNISRIFKMGFFAISTMSLVGCPAWNPFYFGDRCVHSLSHHRAAPNTTGCGSAFQPRCFIHISMYLYLQPVCLNIRLHYAVCSFFDKCIDPPRMSWKWIKTTC